MRRVGLCLVWMACAKGAPPEVVADPLDAPLPFDASVRRGVLDNGLTYLIEANDEPEDRAVFRLVLDAGSILEDPDQLGIAHLLEHMAFNGSDHFEGNGLIDAMQAMGMRFGAHVNAHTGFDETVYKLTVPTEPAQLDTAMLVFQDWAGGLTLSTEEIERERGVVIEEWRRRLGAGYRNGRVTYPWYYKGSPYHERLPIGTLESLQTFKPEAVRRYFEEWYRPDLMAFVAVGDFDVDEMEQRIQEAFGHLDNPETPRARVRPELPDHEPGYIVFTDPEISATWVQLRLKSDDREGSTHRSYRQGLVESLTRSILNERMGAVSRTVDAPYLSAGWRHARLTPSEGAERLYVRAREGEALRAYEGMLVEAERLVQHGVNAGELDRARAKRMRGFEAMLAGLEDEDSSRAVGELIRSFTLGESVPGTVYEVEMAERFLPSITAAEIQQVARALLTEGSRVVDVSMPDKDALTPPTEEALRAVEARVAAMTLEPLEEEAELQPPVDTPAPGSVVDVDTSLVDSLGFTRWTLSNGIEVYWRDSDLEDDQVLFTARSDGGLNLATEDDYVPAATAVGLAQRSGVGRLGVEEIARWNAGKRFSLKMGIRRHNEQFSGSASPGDLEHALALAYARVTAPRFDADAFTLDKTSRAESLRNRLAKPDTVFSDRWNDVVWAADPRWRSWTLDTLEHMDLQRSQVFYNDRFGDLSGTRMVIIGNLPDDLERIVTTWVATLPTGDRDESWVDRGYRATPGPALVEVAAGREPKAQVRLFWSRPVAPPDAPTRYVGDAAARVLKERLREELREKSSGVYSVSASLSTGSPTSPHEYLTIRFTCDPARADELAERAIEVAQEAAAAVPAERYLELVRTQNHRSREERLQTNGYWRDLLLNAWSRGEEAAENHAQASARIDGVTGEAVQAHLQAILAVEPVRGFLRPADQVPSDGSSVERDVTD